MPNHLPKQTQNIIQNFLHLPFDNHDVRCPYFNNRRSGSRGALRVLVGKGTPHEIVEEAQLLARRDKINLEKLSDEHLTKFLIEKNLGIDCAALAYYILDAESKKPLKKIIKFPHAKNPVRKFLTKMRPIENTGVKTLVHKSNSSEIKITNAQAGDMIIMMNGGPRKDYNHVMIITTIDDRRSTITYTHAFQWPSDGEYDHGVRHGEIKITDKNKPLLDQEWTEKNKIGEDNWTYMHGKSADSVMIRRLKQ